MSVAYKLPDGTIIHRIVLNDGENYGRAIHRYEPGDEGYEALERIAIPVNELPWERPDDGTLGGMFKAPLAPYKDSA